jgi:phosphosulfolactate synthase
MRNSSLFAPMIDLAPRTEKPRKSGVTMLNDRGWSYSFVEGILDGYSDVIDIAKLTAAHLYQPEDCVARKVALYKRYGVMTQTGGPILEIARAQGRADEVLEYLRKIGFEAIEVSSESVPNRASDADEAKFMRHCRDMGYELHAEVGKKFPAGDSARLAPNKLNMDEVVRQFKFYLDNGARFVYFEGHVLRAIVGDMGEITEGRDQILEMVERVGLNNIIFEVPATYLDYAGKRALQALLVYLFGPDVNIGNVLVQEVSEIEQIRGGTFPAFGAPCGDHPWLASIHRHGGVAADMWWQGN